MIFTQPEPEPSLRPPTPILTLSNLVTSPLQLQRPLAASRALLSWDLLSPVLLTLCFSQTCSSPTLLRAHSPLTAAGCLLVLSLLCIFQQIQSSRAIHSSVLSVSPTADSH